MKRLLVLLSLFFAIAVAADRFGPADPALRTDLRTTLDTELLGGYVFACPPEQELCIFLPTDTADVTCSTDGWINVTGTDASLCDNGQFNGDSPDEFSRADRPNGFWSHDGASEVAEVVWETEFVATGAGSGNHLLMSMLASNFALICSVTVEDLGAADPADVLLNTTLGSAGILNMITVGASFRFKLTYDPGVADECALWIDPINMAPGTGSLGAVTEGAPSGLIANIVSVRNMNGANLSITKNLAVCPDGCTF